MRRLVPTLVVLFLLTALRADGPAIATPHVALSIEPSKTRVGLARVYLSIGELRWHDGMLEGRYTIRVPMSPSSNDSGTIRLHAPGSLEQIRRRGATLAGHAESAENGERSSVLCDVQRDGRLRIEITTDKRRLSFDTRYRTTG
ncbi:MAG TPA: hypothetical protein VD788_13660 [Candidatus Polarisedimenticolaceae bacterium]|nr:hypothetical protein [Candidatus Polarisedimenticolaceae bacterium]